MINFSEQFNNVELLLATFYASHRQSEASLVKAIAATISMSDQEIEMVHKKAQKFINQIRKLKTKTLGVERLLLQYKLNTEQGVALMCLAEAMLRVPDRSTINELIKDKLGDGDWSNTPMMQSMINRSMYWGLVISGKVLSDQPDKNIFLKTLQSTIRQLGQPALRSSVAAFLKLFASQFVLGQNLKKAIKNGRANEKKGYLYSYDELGEAALTSDDAQRYFEAYRQSISQLGGNAQAVIQDERGISVKLSALHPRYEYSQRESVMAILLPRVKSLCMDAKKRNIGLVIDAEESDRFEMALLIVNQLLQDPDLEGWHGLGIAIQAYQKRVLAALDYLIQSARKSGKRLGVRLTKGAYWDMEIKQAQVDGEVDYPVFTEKKHTDLAYLACAQQMLAARDEIYPMFATHNIVTIMTIKYWAQSREDYEFQRLHGMGEQLYDVVMAESPTRCRIYAPVGDYNELLPYLVRRLLENGASSSFVHQLVDESVSVNELLSSDPLLSIDLKQPKLSGSISKPIDLFGEERQNSLGLDLSCPKSLMKLSKTMDHFSTDVPIQCHPMIVKLPKGQRHVKDIVNPAKSTHHLGTYEFANAQDIQQALSQAHSFYTIWYQTDVFQRANYLDLASNLLQKRQDVFIRLLILEAGKTWQDAVDEVREAIDFLRYYAHQARTSLVPKLLPGPTGERNTLNMIGRGVAVCISPWNFPLAIFTGQVAAALVAGNTVIAKPASQVVAIASQMVTLFREVGLPEAALQLVPGERGLVGKTLINDQRVQLVMLTGSTATARSINKSLANRPGPIIPLVAETGGQNAMIIDSSALIEQAVKDVIDSSFKSAGQRCSAARVVFIQEEVSDKFLKMLSGALAEYRVGPTHLLSNDIGPIIDKKAVDALKAHQQHLNTIGTCIYQSDHQSGCEHGTFFAPCIYVIDRLDQLEKEVFGPILHVIRFKRRDIDDVINQINQTGFGLTFGIHSRVDRFIDDVVSRIHVGNVYINRNIIGAQVGVQPFGGEGLSGTGPKAGGPNYLNRLTKEKTITNNTAAVGGNVELMSMEEILPIENM
ncbi:MAG: bifunctional proline dehydrogenase/L-glutamate gamma-semialdehyde dehydrogenase [Legionellales bacterium]|nr:bifunctional proline dehydrogenase/L-glutamate gamma-semialdehyde dehydrogenase [Legionellales bacterium]OUX66915.1 MAG: hypothetical protein CBD38_04090 [bacterium TMED178]|tara:strand:- start:1879 stop:5037 length:3159 start_codon:yes stop_codon:yes gene_type:complete